MTLINRRNPGTPARATSTTPIADPNTTANPRLCAADALRRRRQASYRLVPLDCGCRDPWPCHCTQPTLSEKFIDAGRDAALHVLEHGGIPLLAIEVLRALYRRGGDDRALAVELHALTGGVAA